MASSSRHHLCPVPDAQPTWLIVGGRQVPARLAAVDGTGARIACGTLAPLGAAVTLRHASAGTIAAQVVAVELSGLRLRFEPGERAMGFALALLASDSAPRRDAA